MSLRTRFILYFGFGGVFFLFIVAALVFYRVELILVQKLEQQFQSDVNFHFVYVNDFFSDQTDRFRAATGLPIYKSMRFHGLTLNKAALKNDIRQMELYYLDLINKNPEMFEIRYVDKQGSEIFRVDRAGIQRDLLDLSQYGVIKKMQELEYGEYKITQKSINNSVQNITWWIPVYVSPEVKYGVMGFSINYQYILDTVGQLVTFEADEVCLSDALGVVLLSSSNKNTCGVLSKGYWYMAERIVYPGLAWELSVSTDQERLLRVLLNALNNACDALVSEEDLKEPIVSPQLTVSTRLIEGSVEIVIADNGVGIPEEIKDRIFEPLFSTKSFGVGLGMPVVKQIIEQHGGSVQIDSKPGVGTQVRLLLPLHVDEAVI